jgi:hypothetical protein
MKQIVQEFSELSNNIIQNNYNPPPLLFSYENKRSSRTK